MQKSYECEVATTSAPSHAELLARAASQGNVRAGYSAA